MYKYISLEVANILKDKVKDVYDTLKYRQLNKVPPMVSAYWEQGLITVELNCDFDTTVAAEITDLISQVCEECNASDPITGFIYPRDMYPDTETDRTKEDTSASILKLKTVKIEFVFVGTIPIGGFVKVLEDCIHDMLHNEVGIDMRNYTFTISTDPRCNLSVTNLKAAVESIKNNPDYKGVEIVARIGSMVNRCNWWGSSGQASSRYLNNYYTEMMVVTVVYRSGEDSNRLLLHTVLGEE